MKKTHLETLQYFRNNNLYHERIIVIISFIYTLLFPFIILFQFCLFVEMSSCRGNNRKFEGLFESSS
jgi:hypothetical protein